MVPPPNDKKRVKVYELRNNDWFDRGTGFCTGRVINVRDVLGLYGQRRRIAFQCRSFRNRVDRSKSETDRLRRTSPRCTSSPKISQSECSWKPRSVKMTVIRNSKVTRNLSGAWGLR